MSCIRCACSFGERVVCGLWPPDFCGRPLVGFGRCVAVWCLYGARSEFWGLASRVPGLQVTLPPSPQIFSVISDTSCHTPYLFFKNTNCVTPPQIIFANLRRFPQNFDFPKTLIVVTVIRRDIFKTFSN